MSNLKVIEPTVFGDGRGYFFESFNQSKYNINRNFVQDNISKSKRNVLRGLHYQLKHPQGKLVTVIKGKILDVAVDLRKSSPSFGMHKSIILSDENHKQFWIPEGFAHGFLTLEEENIIHYKCTDFYYPDDYNILRWNDEQLNIDWNITDIPTMTDKDREAKCLDELIEYNEVYE